MKHFLKIAAGITLAVAVIPATALPQSTWKASAAAAGDVNNDGKFDYSDISALQAFLLGKTAQLSNWQAADLDQNSTVDARDLSRIRRLEPAEEADPDPVYIHLKGNSITSEGGNVDISGRNATITHSGTYYIDGTLDGGQILVNIPDETVDAKTVKLFLNGVNMKNSSAPCIMVENAENTSVNLEPGKENILSDGQEATSRRLSSFLFDSLPLPLFLHPPPFIA